MSSFIDNIKEKNFEEIQEAEITADDIRQLAECYQEILDLKQKYTNATTGRKEIAIQIREKLSPLRSFLHYLTENNKGLDITFEFASEFISDYEMAMRLLVRLANENGDNFILKRFIATDIASFETKHGDREHEQINGNVWVIGEKNVLDQIDEKTYYFGSDFAKITSNVLKEGHSLVIVTDNYYEGNVMPYPLTYISSKIQRTKVKVSGMLSDISCYLYDDNLRSAVNKFMDFINQNGADIEGIDENQLFDIINNKSKKHVHVKENN